MKTPITPEQIDALLPQTQCGLCGFGGCMPYATALATQDAPIHLCPPGGVKGLEALGHVLNKDPLPFIEEMKQKAKLPVQAVINEAECIGCTKCIKACPVDAIVGTRKQMHTIIAEECTGCELCIAPCPVDCIELISVPSPTSEKINHFRQRHHAHQKRLEKTPTLLASLPSSQNKSSVDQHAYIQAALLRAKNKAR